MSDDDSDSGNGANGDAEETPSFEGEMLGKEGSSSSKDDSSSDDSE